MQIVNDPGLVFTKDPQIVVSPDRDFEGGQCLCPNVVRLPAGGYRLYYAERGPLTPKDALGCIQSATSIDGFVFHKEPGLRVGNWCAGAEKRVLAPNVVSIGGGALRMYFEARGRQRHSVILSAVSNNGLVWEIEPGIRLRDESQQYNYGTPCCVALPGTTGWRLYFHRRGTARYDILSARSDDGLRWWREARVRVAQSLPEESYAAYSPYVLRLNDKKSWRMYYAAWSKAPRKQGRILSACSDDGLNWIKESVAVLSPTDGADVRHCSEPALLRLPDGRWRLLYEACDTDGIWRIMSATSCDASDTALVTSQIH